MEFLHFRNDPQMRRRVTANIVLEDSRAGVTDSVVDTGKRTWVCASASKEVKPADIHGLPATAQVKVKNRTHRAHRHDSRKNSIQRRALASDMSN